MKRTITILTVCLLAVSTYAMSSHGRTQPNIEVQPNAPKVELKNDLDDDQGDLTLMEGYERFLSNPQMDANPAEFI